MATLVGFNPGDFNGYRATYTGALNRDFAAVPGRNEARTICRYAHTLVRRRRNQRIDVTRDWAHLLVLAEKNQLEREWWMAKVQQRRSGCLQTLSDAGGNAAAGVAAIRVERARK